MKLLEGVPVYVIPIEMEIMEDGKEFDSHIMHTIQAKTGIWSDLVSFACA